MVISTHALDEGGKEFADRLIGGQDKQQVGQHNRLGQLDCSQHGRLVAGFHRLNSTETRPTAARLQYLQQDSAADQR
jgi:hypothetical protein